jgi:hypothetical protein
MAEYQKYIDILVNAGKEVFVVTENPVLPFRPADYIGRLFRTLAPIPPLMKSSESVWQKEYLRDMEQITNATVIKTIDLFCPEDECMVFNRDGIPLYYDNDHLSEAGSNFQAENLLKPYLQPGY